MCGIVGAVAERDVVPIMIEGLKRLEYRGYDSAGIVVLDRDSALSRVRAVGKISALEHALQQNALHGASGIGHTRWATHGAPKEANAHPHISRNMVAVVHNGIIENHDALRDAQVKMGYEISSDTDTEVIVHQVHSHLVTGMSLLAAVQKTIGELHGAYALGVISASEPGRLVVARRGSPLIIGIGIGEHFVASDVNALLPVTQQFIMLEEGDVASLTRDSLAIYDQHGAAVDRAVYTSELTASVERGEYRHFMLKEIFEQVRAISETLEGRISKHRVPKPRSTEGEGYPRPGRAGTHHRLRHQLSRRHDRATGWNRWRACRARWRLRANSAIAGRWLSRTHWSLPSRSRVKPPIRLPHCAKHATRLRRLARHLQRAKARWYANPTSC